MGFNSDKTSKVFFIFIHTSPGAVLIRPPGMVSAGTQYWLIPTDFYLWLTYSG